MSIFHSKSVAIAPLLRRFQANPFAPLDEDDSQAMIGPIRGTDMRLPCYAIHPEVDGTNNISERHLRQPAQARHTGQTNKTALGARRRSFINSVIDSLRLHLPQLTL